MNNLRRFSSLLGVTSLLAVTSPAQTEATTEVATHIPAEPTTTQAAKLDALIARDVAAARAGGVRAFRDTFSTRLSAEDFAAAGLDDLTPEEISTLDARVAREIAAAGRPTDPLAAHRIAQKKSENPESFAIPKLPLEVHGSITGVYGASKRGDFYGGAVETTVFDPNHGWSATIGLSSLQGAVPWTYHGYRDTFGYGYDYLGGFGPGRW